MKCILLTLFIMFSIITLKNLMAFWALVATPKILATQEAEMRRIKVSSQPGQILGETLSGKNPPQNRTGRVAQGVGPEFKPSTTHKNTTIKRI
jgi:hypothetical protein